MKALAVTDHGNMFGAVALLRRGHRQGHQADPGLRDLRGPRQPPRQGGVGHRRGLQPHDAAGRGRGRLPQPRQAGLDRLHGGLLPPAAHRQGSAGLAQPRGSSASRAASPARSRSTSAPARRRPRWSRSGVFSEIFGKDRFYLEVMDHGIEEQRRVNQGLFRLHGADRPAAGGHQRRALPAPRGPPGPRRAALHRLGQEGARDASGCASTPRSSTSRARRRWRRVFPDHPEALASTVAIAEMCDFKLQAGGRAARLRRAARLHHRELLREGDARRLRGPAAGCWIRWPTAGRLRHTLADYEARLDKEIGVIRRVGFAGYFLIVWDFIRYAREHGIPVGPGRGSAAGIARGLLAAHHRHRSHRARPHLRALPERGAHLAPRHRHRLLREPARRGDRIRHAQVRPRERGPDHHLRDHEGEGGGARRGPRARHELRRRRQDREDDPVRPEDDAGQGPGGVAAAAGRLPEGPARSRS